MTSGRAQMTTIASRHSSMLSAQIVDAQGRTRDNDPISAWLQPRRVEDLKP
jgi:hypothetical protein